MEFTDIMGLLGGLALFLYGMQMMSSGLEAAAGDKMKQILEKLTSNRFLGVFVGAVITAIIQSSSATTVMVVGFVNAGMMTLRQAVWIIMGANIGTTITGQLIALDVGAIAPLIAFLGVAVVVFCNNQKLRHIGNIFAGLGILFIGMDMMGGAMKPLANSPEFVNLLSKFENPVLGIIAGAIFTAIIQSSSASVGILQALANSGVVQLSSAAFVLFGQNIGTCITALLASIGTGRSAKRTTIIHITFNVIGTAIFTTLCILTPLIVLIEKTAPGNPAGQIANLHTIFNVVTSILLIPFGTYLADVAEKILPDKGEENSEMHLKYIRSHEIVQEDQLGASAVTMNNVKLEIQRMIPMADRNVNRCLNVFRSKNVQLMNLIEETEDYIDFLNKEISKYISKVIIHERTVEGSRIFNSYFKIASNIERIGDHATNIARYAIEMKEKNVQLSEKSKQEILEMQEVCEELFAQLISEEAGTEESHNIIIALEQRIDEMTETFRHGTIERIQKGICSDEGSIYFSEMLTDFERIGDYAYNVSKRLKEIRTLNKTY